MSNEFSNQSRAAVDALEGEGTFDGVIAKFAVSALEASLDPQHEEELDRAAQATQEMFEGLLDRFIMIHVAEHAEDKNYVDFAQISLVGLLSSMPPELLAALAFEAFSELGSLVAHSHQDEYGQFPDSGPGGELPDFGL